jgi:zinc protease
MNETFRRQTPPEPLAQVPFEIPKFFETELSNGLRIVVFEDERLPLVSFRLCFFFGDADEPNDLIGITSAVSSMFNEGTQLYNSRQLAEQIEKLGASISASSSADFTIVSASSLSLYTSEIFRLMAEMVLFPTFPENELNLYKQNTIEGLKFQRSQPSFLASEQILRVLYGKHPYGVASPKPSDIEKLERDKLIDFHGRSFVPNNAMLIVVGDVKKEEFLREIEDVFGGWQRGDVEERKFESPKKPDSRKLTIVDRPGSAQSNIVLGSLALERKNPDYFPVLVMNQILGAGASSRIFMNLREEKGYTYGAYSRFDMKKRGGEFEATAEVRTAVTYESLKEFFYELERIRSEKVREDELNDAKNFLTGVFPIRAETQEGLTNLIVSQKLYNLPDDYLQTYRDNINAVSIEDVGRVAEKYIEPEKMAIVIVGDGREVLSQARSFAEEIEIYDTNGDKKDMSNYETDENAETANVNGDWKLTLDVQGQKLPVYLFLEQAETEVSGTIKSMLGSGRLYDGKLNGNRFSAAARTEVEGEELELGIAGVFNDDSFNGTVSTALLPDPLSFSGKRRKNDTD